MSAAFSGDHLKKVEGVRFVRQWDAFYSPSGEVDDRFFLRRRSFFLRQNRDAPDQLSPQDLSAIFSDSNQKIRRNVLWIRWLSFHHFGHLLTETIGCLWPLLLDEGRLIDNDMDILIPSAFKKRHHFKKLIALFPERQHQFVFAEDLEQCGLNYEAIFLPEQSIINYQKVSPSHLLFVRQFLDRYMRYICQLNPVSQSISQELLNHPAICSKSLSDLKRIYLSRSRLVDEKRALISEKSLEQALLNRGWAVLHPQQLPLNLQLALLNNAECVAGVTGSAFHLLMGLEKVTDKKVVTLDKAKSPKKGPKDTYALQFKCQGLQVKRLRVVERFKDVQSGFPRLKFAHPLSSDDVAQMMDDYSR